MSFFNFAGLWLEIEQENGNRQITKGTPQVDFLRSHKADLEREIGAIREMCRSLPPGEISHIWDLMAGCGFSGRIFQQELGELSLFLNDLDPGCADILRHNFSESALCSNEDAFDFVSEGRKWPDLTFIDFNNHTLRTSVDWTRLTSRIRSEYFCLTDSACYGFKFGNLKAYDCQTPVEYYAKLGRRYYGACGYGLVSVFPFGPAALILMKKNYVDSFEVIQSQKIPITIMGSKNEGFKLI